MAVQPVALVDLTREAQASVKYLYPILAIRK